MNYEYKLNQTITVSYKIRNIALTQDHSFLVIGAYNGSNVDIYKHNGSQFNMLQTLVNPKVGNIFVSITDDHSFLTVTSQS